MVRLDAANRRVVVGPRAALRMLRMRSARRELARRRACTALAAGRLEVFVKVRSTRPPQPAWLTRTGEQYEVELVDGEEGVAPGQACVFYDAPTGQAHVLGGGFIKSATAHAGLAERRTMPTRAPRSRLTRTSKSAHDKDTLDQQTLDRAMRAGRRSTTSCSARCSTGRKASIEAAEQVGGRILDVGIGTGISLMDFSRRNRIVGVDISEPMLRARAPARGRGRPDNVECLAVMDAERLGFRTIFFDVSGGAIRHHRGPQSGRDARGNSRG